MPYVAPGGPVSRALAVMAEPVPVTAEIRSEPQFAVGSPDLTALAIGCGCILCWLSPAALWIGGSL